MSQAPLIYYVEDDEHIRDLTAYALRQAGMTVRAFPDGEGFAALCAAEPPDAVLLDIMLPGDDGLALLQALRSQVATEHLPIMMLTAKGTEFDKVVGLDGGADDYLAKPFGMMELISRVNALLRRASRPAQSAAGENSPEPGDVLKAGSVVLSPSARTVTAAGHEVNLTRKEFDLLRVLLEHKGRVLTREQLLDQVWGVSFVGETRTVDMHVKTLRRKLAEAAPGSEAAIATVRGVGYQLKEWRGDQ
ncbi:response regulator transcription factor [Adlercreutzia sp. R25]|uniref:response regulator transcription factor n=1 Tax=Adlercreutzia shanghongiae TaxID=3111773 RepID=UPI002DB79337|nr:response regulator transcription factor [Adlercreutzia sp. R25]MEC4271981.1 response regulator transcription factor [Adlercreutzia sp. R25]